jgi:hypothetical protein
VAQLERFSRALDRKAAAIAAERGILLADTKFEFAVVASRNRSVRWRSVGYWLATAVVAGELLLGGLWDIARPPFVADLVTHLGYPSYFLVLLGSWKVLGAIAMLIPRYAVLKEWAYAGALFTYTGAIVSHLVTGYDLAEVGLLAVFAALTVLSWALRPPSRRTPRPMPDSPTAESKPARPAAVQRWYP